MKRSSSFSFKDSRIFRKFEALFGGSTPIATVVSCLLCIVAPLVLCFVFVGPQTLLEYASESKPYSILLSPSSYSSLNEEETATKIVCFGDSNYFYPPHQAPKSEVNEVYLPTMLHDEIESKTAIKEVVITQRAFPSAGMFDYYCILYEAMKFSPDLVIVPINWRSFGVDKWDALGVDWLDRKNWYHPELSAFAPLRQELLSDDEDPLRFRGISVAKHIQYKMSLYSLYPIGMKAWALENAKSLLVAMRENVNRSAFAETTGPEPSIPGTAIFNGNQILRSTKEMAETFPLKIEDSNLTFRSIAPLARVASERGVKVLFFVWPLDQEAFEEAGYMDKPSLERSIDLLEEAVDEKNIYFMDLSDLLGHEHFFDKFAHCTIEGRREIARALAPKIGEILAAEDAGSSE